jgi:hypothetical protein
MSFASAATLGYVLSLRLMGVVACDYYVVIYCICGSTIVVQEMATEITTFVCNRAKSYQWLSAVSVRSAARGERTEQPFLIETGDIKRYTPNAPEFSGLFRELANLPPTQEAILDFALQYGWLGQMEPVSPGTFGDSLVFWDRAIRDLHKVVQDWDNLRSRSPEVPRQLRMDGADGFPYFHPWGQLLEVINRALKEHNVIVGLARSSEPHRNSAHDAFNLQLVPRDLLAFCWLQFAHAVEGDKAYRQCERCRRWFESGGRAARSDKRFCSPTCKSAAHQKKQTLARRLRREGKTLRDIAAQINVKQKVLKGWIKE